ncbi:MAG: (Fe-S)-binding protein, partial [Dehalococcoidales bacterium]
MVIGILTAIGLACGLIIFFVYLKVPQKVKGLEKTEKINSVLPGLNCGACGYAGCFGYAQALSKDPDVFSTTPCSMVLQDEERLEELGKILGVKLDASGMTRKAVVRCTGNSEIACSYSGAPTCKGAAQLLSGYKKCPYACLGFGDCVEV